MTYQPLSSLVISRRKLLSRPAFIASIGAPGSGKSTFFDKLLTATDDDDYANWWLRLERDRFREAMFGTRRAFWDHPMHLKTKSEMVRKSMRRAMDEWPCNRFALTDTGSEDSAAVFFARAANSIYSKWLYRQPNNDLHPNQTPTYLMVFEQPLEVLIDRNRTRPVEHRVPEALLTERYDEMYGPSAWWRDLKNSKLAWNSVHLLRPEQIVD